MGDDIKVRKVTQDVLKYVWFKNKIIMTEPLPELCFMPEISAELMNNLSNSVWIQSVRNGFEWEEFVINHFERMTASPFRFVNYIAYVSFHVFGKFVNAYEFFFETLSFVTFFTLHCWQRKRKLYINACVDLFCAIFEEGIRTKFENQGGWKNFNEFLDKLEIFEIYRPMINGNVCLFEHFKNFRDSVTEHFKNFPGAQIFQIINGVSIGGILRNEVESDKRALTFAKSVADKLRELGEKEFKEILADFERIDHQVKTLYLRQVGEASGRMLEEKDFSSQKIQNEILQNISSECRPEKKVEQTIPISGNLKNRNFVNIDSQDNDASYSALRVSPKSAKLRTLLGNISMDISKLSDIVQSLCQQYEVQIPPKRGSDRKE